MSANSLSDHASRVTFHSAPLDAFFNPTGVAVIGASADPQQAQPRRAAQPAQLRLPGAVYPVNPRADEILGLPLLSRHRRRARSGGAGGADGAGGGLPGRADGLRPCAASRRPSSSPAAFARWALRDWRWRRSCCASPRRPRHAADRPQLRRHAGRPHRPQHHLHPHHAQARATSPSSASRARSAAAFWSGRPARASASAASPPWATRPMSPRPT